MLTTLVRATVVAVTLGFCSHAAGQGFSAAMDRSPEALAQRAAAMRLHEEQTWRALLHYQRTCSGYESEADGPEFFLAPEGRTDPGAELKANVRALFTVEPAAVEGAGEHPQCRFPARYFWLKTKLGLSDQEAPDQECSDFQTWRDTLAPSGITFIYSAAYINNPASMFGHSFLRLDRKTGGVPSPVLSYTVNFSAVPTTSNPFIYTLMGVFGGFKGSFDTVPYYLKIREYGSMEHRDLWEFELAVEQAEVDFLVMHAWEMGQTWFDYYYFDENCSYQILALLTVIRPAIDFPDSSPTAVFPLDTLRILLGVPGLVKSQLYRPSLRRRMQAVAGLLSRSERKLAASLAQGPDAQLLERLERLPPERRYRVLDAAALRLRFREGYEQSEEDERKVNQRERELVLLRSKLGLRLEAPAPAEPDPPQSGHDLTLVRLVGGWATGGPFQEIHWRGAIHDVLADQSGFPAETQIEMLAVEARFDDFSRQLYLDRVALVDIVSLVPFERWVHKVSWRLAVGGRMPHEDGGDDVLDTAFELAGGPGLSLKTSLFDREVYYLFLDAAVRLGALYDYAYLAEFGGTAGLLVQFFDGWRIQAEGTCRWAATGSRFIAEPRFSVNAGMNITLGKDFELRILGRHHFENYQEASLLLGYYY